MSYCRFMEADVYVFASVLGCLECCACSLENEDWSTFTAHSTQEMVDHLKAHEELGHYVPERVYKDLWADDKTNFKGGDTND